MSWMRIGSWEWTHSITSETFCLNSNGRRFTQDRMRLDLLREGFRADCFQKWSMSTRNDAEACQGIVRNESRCQMTRQLEQQSQHRFAIRTGGFVSAAAFDVMKGTSSRCSCGAFNSLDHMVWWCQHVPLPSQRPPVPTDWLQRRLGWPSGSPYDEATISWMVHRGLLPTDISHLHNSEVIAQLICQLFLENYSNFALMQSCFAIPMEQPFRLDSLPISGGRLVPELCATGN